MSTLLRLQSHYERRKLDLNQKLDIQLELTGDNRIGWIAEVFPTSVPVGFQSLGLDLKDLTQVWVGQVYLSELHLFMTTLYVDDVDGVLTNSAIYSAGLLQ